MSDHSADFFANLAPPMTDQIADREFFTGRHSEGIPAESIVRRVRNEFWGICPKMAGLSPRENFEESRARMVAKIFTGETGRHSSAVRSRGPLSAVTVAMLATR